MRTFLYIFIIISFMASCSLKKTGQVSNKLDENSIEFVFYWARICHVIPYCGELVLILLTIVC